MNNNNTDLGLGNVDAFGLDEMGQPVGLNPVWGAVVGTGLGTATAIATRQFMPQYAGKSELIGFGVSALASGAMIAFEGTRAAGWTSLASAVLNNGLRSVELMFFSPGGAEMAVDTPPVSGHIGQVVVDPAEVLGLVEINPTQVLGDGAMPTLVGSIADASQHTQLVGGPALATHGGHWGATVMG